MKLPFLYFNWLQKDNPVGTLDRLPDLKDRFETSVPGLYCIGDLTGIPLIKLAADSGHELLERLFSDRQFAQEKRDKKDADLFDLVIIGAGPSGVSASLAALHYGFKHVLLESSGKFNTIANFPTGKPIYVTPLGPMKSALKFSDGTKESLLAQLSQDLTGKDIPLREGEMVTRVRKGSTHFSVETAAATYRALRVVVAIGKSGATRRLGVPGEDLPKVFTRLIDPGEYRESDILVVGGGDSAVEAAVALAKNGNRITLSYRRDTLSRPKERNRESFDELVKAGAITPVFESTVREIRGAEVVLAARNGVKTIPNRVVYSLIGTEPPVAFLKRADIRLRGENRFSDWVAIAAFLFFAMLLYFGKKAPATVIAGALDFLRVPSVLGHLAWPARIDGLAAWLGLFGVAACGTFLAVHLVKNGSHYFSSVWNGFKYGYYLAIVVLFCFLYVSYKLLAQHPVFADMGIWYTAMYSLTIVVFGLRRIYIKPTGYIKRQTSSLMAIQLLALFILPVFVVPYLGSHHLLRQWIMNNVFPDQSYWRAFGFVLAWPLFIYNLATGAPSLFWLILGLIQTFVIIPVIVFKWGKGAYCGWICPCGGMAETLGDEYRIRALHGRAAKRADNIGQVVLWFAGFATIVVLMAGAGGSRVSVSTCDIYGLLVDVVFAGVIGLGAYFYFSGRVWCRFLCPLAALMHIYARFSVYRIMANKKRCISCNICTKVCHMGIDVMGYANKGIPMNDVQCVRCSACIVNCPLQVLTFGTAGSVDIDNKKYKRARFPLTPGWKSGLPQKDIDMLLREAEDSH